MNRLVREHYPVDKLPEDLRQGLEGTSEVTVTIDADTAPNAAAPRDGGELGLFTQFKHLRRENFSSDQAVDDYVRGLRDEWAHRER